MHQLIFNLVVNGVQHGTGAVGVEAVGDDEQITITVASTSQPIPAGALPTLFDPLTRALPLPESRRASPGMGRHVYRPLHCLRPQRDH
ncbi:ATP-binding protein [Paraburkholderia caribensis]|uniref:ATP-binding protein n=1 Tax=Paraburkholderia caribensis TaxID=75105 RepID=UPI00338F7477